MGRIRLFVIKARMIMYQLRFLLEMDFPQPIAQALNLLAGEVEIFGVEQLPIRVSAQELLADECDTSFREAVDAHLVEAYDAIPIEEVLSHRLDRSPYRARLELDVVGGIEYGIFRALRRKVATVDGASLMLG